MKYSRFIQELTSSPVICTRGEINRYLPIIKSHLEGKLIEFPEKPGLRVSAFSPSTGLIPDINTKPKGDKLAIVPVQGFISRYGSWWDYGTEELAERIHEINADESVKAIIIRVNSGGGSVDAIFPIKEAIQAATVPVVAAIDSRAFSLGYYIAALADKIVAVDNMAEVGSIGVVATHVSQDEMYKQWGIEFREIYPPESDWKNKWSRDIDEGNDSTLITEDLTPWAKHFQSIVRENRPSLVESVEGTLRGRTFFAGDKQRENALDNGLIDMIMPFNQILDMAYNLDPVNDKIKQLFN